MSEGDKGMDDRVVKESATESIRAFEDWECWKACRELRRFIVKRVVPMLPHEEKYRLEDQIIRAARSTTANIAEGYGRFHYLENAKFCRNSRGSCAEVLDHLIAAADEDLLHKELLNEGRALVENSTRLLNGYIRYLHRAASKTQSVRGSGPSRQAPNNQ